MLTMRIVEALKRLNGTFCFGADDIVDLARVARPEEQTREMLQNLLIILYIVLPAAQVCPLIGFTAQQMQNAVGPLLRKLKVVPYFAGRIRVSNKQYGPSRILLNVFENRAYPLQPGRAALKMRDDESRGPGCALL